MSNHQKRLSVPNSWPVERKEETFTIKADAGPHGEGGVPLLVVLRDVLSYVDSRKEARYALNQDAVLVNGDAVSDEARPIGMFDILAFPSRDESYRIFPGEGGRLALTEIDEDAASSRLGKITGKRQVDGGEFQLSLHDGTNIQLEDASEYSVNDSLVIDNEEKDVVAHFEYGEGALVTAVDGQHAGEIGEVEDILVTPGSGRNAVTVSTETSSASPEAGEAGGKGQFETVEEYVVTIDENFVGDDDE